MKITVSSTLPVPANEVWQHLQRSSTLVYVAKGVVEYANADTLPKYWPENEPIELAAVVNNRPPVPHQVVFTNIDHTQLEMTTAEHSAIFQEWNHTMRVHPLGAEKCIYTDSISIRATNPWLTMLVSVWVWRFYRHRHRRWKQLIAEHRTA